MKGDRRSRGPHRRQRPLYERKGSLYDLATALPERPVREAVIAMLAPAPGDRVLEVGCGPGRLAVGLAQAVGPRGRVDAVDRSPQMLRRAARRAARAGLGARVRFCLAEPPPLPYSAGEFDDVVMVFLLETLPAEDAELLPDECRRVLSSCGRLCAAAVSEHGGFGPAVVLYQRLHAAFPQFIDCRPICLRERFARSGFQTVQQRIMRLFGLGVEIVLARPAD